ncbi:DUF3592 domain-containing protein [Saccharibacillus alkalitolerans]|uniref:DUF3592 domain-containing protein n=1 Tax=Saccharibacillus alkalitolerans TaxID=2705290 RepID=A0ABX0F3K0_9BACL|nr:DUF3592 domain-containing protein [Saccharibacillus alkalitolerans]NGZ74574.1 DUF3592 domain-containing protein [Saccharibacillus alkalitolerans]
MNGAGSETIFWILGAAFIVFGLYSVMRRRKLSQSEHTVPGEIVRYEELAETPLERSGAGVKYYPVVRFETKNGTVEHVSRSGSSARPQPSGAKVDVHYDPEDPSAFELLSGSDAARREAAPIVLGVVFLGIGVALSL